MKFKRLIVFVLIFCMCISGITVTSDAASTSKLRTPTITLSNVKDTGKVKVSWKKINNAKSYKVYRSSNGKKWNRISTTTKTSITNKNAVAGKKYYYKVKAIASKSSSNSSFSKVKSRYCDLARPSVTLTNIKSTGNIKVSWKKISKAKSYKVYKSTNGKKWSLMTTTTKTYVTDKKTAAGKKYYYKVRAIASKSDANSSHSAVRSKLCVKPFDVKIALKNGVPRLTWNKVSGAKKYNIYRSYVKDGDYKKITSTKYNSLTNQNAPKGLTLYFKVEAVNSSGKVIGTSANPVSITVSLPEEKTVTNYVLKPSTALYKLPSSNSKSITLPYMAEVTKGDPATTSSSGSWVRVWYKGNLYYSWHKPGAKIFTDKKSTFTYTCDTPFQQDVVDFAKKIALEWRTVYEHHKSDGIPNNDGTYGFDCSGYATYVLNTVMQKTVPTYRLSSNIPTLIGTDSICNKGYAGEFKADEVSLDNIQPGDIIFFSQKSPDDHCGIYLGNGEFAHSSDFWSNSVVIAPLTDEYIDELSCIRRYLPDPSEVSSIGKEMEIKQGCNSYKKMNSDSQKVDKFTKGETVTLLYTNSGNNGNWGYVRNQEGKEMFILLKNLGL